MENLLYRIQKKKIIKQGAASSLYFIFKVVRFGAVLDVITIDNNK